MRSFGFLACASALSVLPGLPTPAFASSDDAWKELWQKSEPAQYTASTTSEAARKRQGSGKTEIAEPSAP